MNIDRESTKAKIVNALLFQAGWLGCVLGGNVGAVAALIGILLIHALFFVKNTREWLVVIAFSLSGIIIDSLLVYTGIFQTTSVLAPLWLMCLWVILSLTLCHSLSWLHNHLPLASVIGGIAGPFSYWAGSQFVEITLHPIPGALFTLALIWAILLPVGLLLARRLTAEKIATNKIEVATAGDSKSGRVVQSLSLALLISTLANPVVFSSKAKATPPMNTEDIHVIGTAYDIKGREVLYTELHSLTQGPGRQVRYISPQGEMVAKKEVDYSRSAIGPSFRQENYWSNEVSLAQWDGNRLVMGFGPAGMSKASSADPVNAIKQKSLSVDKVVIDAGFDNFIREHWQALLSGQTLRYEFAVASKLTTLRMRIKLDTCNDKIEGIDYEQTVCFKTEPDNALFRLLSAPIELSYQRNTQRLQRYRGRGNITNQQGALLDVDIRYEYISMPQAPLQLSKSNLSECTAVTNCL